MKRTVPLVITAIVGFVLIASAFIPFTESWGEVASVWFDVLAAIAFVLGGGNLLKVHLKKISDQQAGWGYSAVTLIAFLATLSIGLSKLGVPPASEQEYYGESFAPLALSDFPKSQTFQVEGEIPPKPDGALIAASIRQQLFEEDGNVKFKGWMRASQKKDLVAHNDQLEWQCLAETLHGKAQPPKELKGMVNYYADHQALSFKGVMSDGDRNALKELSDNSAWTAAVDQLYEQSRKSQSVDVEAFPKLLYERMDYEEVTVDGRPENKRGTGTIRDILQFRDEKLDELLTINTAEKTLTIQGPMSKSQRDLLANSLYFFPPQRPFTPSSRERLLSDLQQDGDELSEAQLQAFNKLVDGVWKLDDLVKAMNAAGQAKPTPKSACKLLEEKNAGVNPLEPTTKPSRLNWTLNGVQIAELREFEGADGDFWEQSGMPEVILAADSFSQTINQLQFDFNIVIASKQQAVSEYPLVFALLEDWGFELYDSYWETVFSLSTLLAELGPRYNVWKSSLDKFLSAVPSEAEFKKQLYTALIKAGPLSSRQKQFLLSDFQTMTQWREDVGRLFLAAHVTKFRWSGNYSAQGSAFWWIYQYVLKPLTATMFAMLAFYVASAAFRAFRAKNTEAILLLGTAFIILLGRTYAGVMLTSGIPDSLSGLRIEEISVFIMQVFNTAGNRAIMIGIALGVASTSLKVLLGVDRSWLGSSED